MPKKTFGDPNMSDTLLLVSVEDLINIAMGPADHNAVNYKLIQTILHILARQMRLLEQRVEIRITDEHLGSPGSPKRKRSPSKVERRSRSPEKEKDKAQREKEKRQKEIEKAEKAASIQKEKADKAASKDKVRAVSKEKDMADKDKEKTDKTTEKGERATSKERDKAEKAAAKEKADRATSKEREKADKTAAKEADKGERAKAEKDAAKEKEKAGKATAKDRDKADKEVTREKEKSDKAKGKEKAEKEAVKEKEKAGKEDKERAKSKDRGKSRTVSNTSIVVSEVERRKEKVLVVEKGPTTRADKGREGIEVVTRSQFEIVEALVQDLQKRAGPLPPPALPDNQKLRSDLVKGNASLTDTMQAMQVTARVRAAEQAIGRMGELLTALAAAGALPEDLAGEISGVKFEPPDADAETITTLPMKTKSAVSRKSVAIDPMAMTSETSMGRRPSMARPSATSRASVAGVGSATSKVSLGSMAGLPPVTHPELDEAIRSLREDLSKNVQIMTAKATAVAEHSAASAKAVSDKLDIALKLDNRISTLYSLTSDYAEQLSGFDAGLTTQMQSFRDQIGQMRGELQAGLTQLEQVNNNAETAAVLELTERYEGLVTELDHTVHAHRALTTFQKQLGDELHSLVECVEMLREQKADRDEVLDGLRDKADNSRLQGLLTAIEFAHARLELEKRLDVCHDKFRRQESVWMAALRDLTDITENKAEITQLLAAREEAENMLRELQDKQMKLAVILGEPKAAMLTRELARGAVCGSCMAPALMDPMDASYGAPPPLPAMRPRPVGGPADEPCAPEWKPPEPPDDREHICHRWVGGSHTLLSEAVTREAAPPAQLQVAPTKRYTGYGDDGRLYMLEEDLQPCVECNKLPVPIPEESTPEQGAGDQGPPPPAV